MRELDPRREGPRTAPWSRETTEGFLRFFLGTAAGKNAHLFEHRPFLNFKTHRDHCIPRWHHSVVLFHLKNCQLLPAFSIKRPSRVPVSVLYYHHPFNAITPCSLSLIPLSLFYSSLTKLFLLFLLTIWRPASSSPVSLIENGLPAWVSQIWNANNSLVTTAFGMLDDDKLDREWIVRNVLGGMSAGFGLRGMFLWSWITLR